MQDSTYKKYGVKSNKFLHVLIMSEFDYPVTLTTYKNSPAESP